jgi:hypothetical protein
MAKPKPDSTLRVDMYFPDMEELRAELKKLPTNLAAKHFGAALRKAVQPGLTALRQATPKGPTGNLRRSIKTKVKTYPRNGTAVGMVGYSWGGENKGYHQGFIEFGTKERKTKGPVASSFKKRGQFTIARPRKLGKPPKNLFGAAGDRYAARYRSRLKVQTNPKYPKAFFKRAAAGEVVKLGKMPIGGRTGVPPVKTAFNRAKPAMEAELRLQLGARIEKAWAELEGRTKRGLQTTYNSYREKKILDRLFG